MMKADVIGRAETWIVGIKIAILLLFVGLGFFAINTSQLAPSTWATPLHMVAGGMIIFLAYEGFELIANTAHDIREPSKTLPRAYYISVVFVVFLYIAVAAVTVGGLSLDKIIAAEDYALAAAARPFLGQLGFGIIAIAAVLSTSSAINATLYGAARLSFTIAKEGELPEILEKKIWHRPAEGLLITGGATLLMANLFDLSSISTVGSAGFLIIFAAVNIANIRLRNRTNGSAVISTLGSIACIGALAVLIWQTVTTNPARVLALVAMIGLSFAVEGIYRLVREHEIDLRPR
jgi:amino acid transporter